MISVIVPVYGVEAFLDKCVRSIVTQTYRDLEIILVDDESPDKCPAMCDAWAQRDPRIRVLHNRHGGLSDARNKGLEASSGEFIVFVDSDDYLAPEHCEKLLAVQQEKNADIVVSNFVCCSMKGKQHTNPFAVREAPCTLSGKEALALIFPPSGLTWHINLCSAWAKLYRRDIFMGKTLIRYPVGRIYEDDYLCYKAYFAAHIISFIPDALYFYVRREGSITACVSPTWIRDLFAITDDLLPWLKDKDPDTVLLLEHALYTRYLSTLYYALYLDDRREADVLGRHYWKLLRNSTSPYLKNPKAGLRFKFYYVLHLVHLLTPMRRVKRLFVGIIKRGLKAVGLFDLALALKLNPRLVLHPRRLFADR